MVFASPIFLFLFLPLVLAGYFGLPRRWGNAVLLAASLCFYIWGEGLYAAIVLASIAFNWLVGRKLGDAPDTSRRRWLTLGIAGNLTLLAIFKYANFAAANLNAALTGLHLEAWTLSLATVTLPLGISFFTFHAISYLVDIHRGNAVPQRRAGSFALYILLFPQLIAGPIIRYKDIAGQIISRDRRFQDVAEGTRRFIFGLGKKMLVANTLGRVADQIFGIAPTELAAPIAWLGVVCYALQIYFDFSGYSDMAIGLMRMFGFRVLENFNYPYISQSVREFWRRWHISLSNFFRDYLYIPLGGNERGKARTYANLLLVFLLCGLWHGASWTFVLWGGWHGVFLIAERAGLGNVLTRTWRPLRHAYALAAIVGGWVLFRCDTLGHAGAYYMAMGGMGASEAAAALKYPPRMLLDNLTGVTLGAALIGAMPVGRWLLAATGRGGPVGPRLTTLFLAAEWLWLAAVLVASCAYLAAGTYNPFIYFRF
jgi:alginate O-acetyltransferase complex protein AlgI